MLEIYLRNKDLLDVPFLIFFLLKIPHHQLHKL